MSAKLKVGFIGCGGIGRKGLYRLQRAARRRQHRRGIRPDAERVAL